MNPQDTSIPYGWVMECLLRKQDLFITPVIRVLCTVLYRAVLWYDSPVLYSFTPITTCLEMWCIEISFTWNNKFWWVGKGDTVPSLIARFVGPTWGPPGADRTQEGPMLAPWTLLSGIKQPARHERISNYWDYVTVCTAGRHDKLVSQNELKYKT